MKILMVCLGNICRSPMAEGILRDKIRENNLDISIDSCGTGDWHVGQKADPRAIKQLYLKGIDITDLRARHFHLNDFDEFDLIYCMDQSNYNDILALSNNKNHQAKVKMILNEVSPGINASIPDPYYGGDGGFENVYQLLDEATNLILQKHA